MNKKLFEQIYQKSLREDEGNSLYFIVANSPVGDEFSVQLTSGEIDESDIFYEFCEEVGEDFESPKAIHRACIKFAKDRGYEAVFEPSAKEFCERWIDFSG